MSGKKKVITSLPNTSDSLRQVFMLFFSSLLPLCIGWQPLMRSVRGQTMASEFARKRRQNPTKPQKRAFKCVSWGQVVTASVVHGSGDTPSAQTICPRRLTFERQNWHLSKEIFSPTSAKLFKCIKSAGCCDFWFSVTKKRPFYVVFCLLSRAKNCVHTV